MNGKKEIPFNILHTTKIINDLDYLHPSLRAKVEAVLRDCKGKLPNGRQVIVYETFRSRERQERLYRQGVTKLKNVGMHYYGLAVDFAVTNVNGNLTWNYESDYQLIGRAAKAHNLIWGGDWDNDPKTKNSFNDLGHVQLIKVVDQNKVISGEWYPEEDYSL